MKKLMASLLSVVLVLSLSAPLALAEEPTGEAPVVVEAGAETGTSTETETGTEIGTVTEETETETDEATGDEAETDTDVAAPGAEAGVTPDSWFYSFDRAMEQVQLFLAQGEVAKTALLEKLAAERLAEAEQMLGAEQQELAQQMLNEFAATLRAITENLEAASLNTDSTEDDEQLVALIGSMQALREGFQLRVEEIMQQLDESLAADPTEAIDEAEDTADAVDQLKSAEESKLTTAIVNVYGLDEDIFAQLSEAGLNFGQSKMIAILMGRVNQNKAEGGELMTVEDAVAVYKKGWGQLKKEYGLKSGELGLAIGQILKQSKAVPVENEDEDDDDADEQAAGAGEAQEREQNTLRVTTKSSLEVKTQHHRDEKGNRGNGQAKGKNK